MYVKIVWYLAFGVMVLGLWQMYDIYSIYSSGSFTVFDAIAIAIRFVIALCLIVVPTCIALAIQGANAPSPTNDIKNIDKKLDSLIASLQDTRTPQQSSQEEDPQPRQAPVLPKNPFTPSTVDYGDATGGRSNPLGQFESGGNQNRPPPA